MVVCPCCTNIRVYSTAVRDCQRPYYTGRTLCARLPGFDMVEVPGSRSVHWSPKSLWSVQRVAVLVTVYCFCQIPNSKSITFHHNLEYSNLESATILYIILYQHISQVRSNSPVTFRFQRVPAGVARKRWPACPGEDDMAAEGRGDINHTSSSRIKDLVC